MKILILLGIIIGNGAPAHAGWFRDWCNRNLIAADPYQFETTPIEWIRKEHARLDIKALWGTATDDDREMLVILKRELDKRAAIEAITYD